MVVELADARGRLTDVVPAQPAVHLERLPVLLLEFPQPVVRVEGAPEPPLPHALSVHRQVAQAVEEGDRALFGLLMLVQHHLPRALGHRARRRAAARALHVTTDGHALGVACAARRLAVSGR